MELTKDDLYQLEPTISSPVMFHADAERDSYYRGHLTLLVGRNQWAQWVAWVEYDRVGGPGMMRAAVTKQPTDFDDALQLLNDRLRTKQYANRNGRLYQPISPSVVSGQITEDLVAEREVFLESMQQLFAS